MKSSYLILKTKIANEQDILHVRQRTRQLGVLGGLTLQSQTRFVTAVSEIARNALKHASGGTASFSLVSEDGAYRLEVAIGDNGPGISTLDRILSDQNEVANRKGILAAKNLVHYFDVETGNKGTQVRLAKKLNSEIASAEETINRWSKSLLTLSDISAIEELQEQNHQLILALAEIQASKELLSKQQDLLKERTEQLERADRLKASFVANMSHEMRTPLNAIIGISDILSKTTLNKHQQFLVNSLDAAGRSLLSLINDILDISKLEAGKFEIEDIDFSMVDVVREALSVVQPQAMEKYVDLLLFSSPFVPDKVQGDPHRLQQVIINIVANAIKFSNQNSETSMFVFAERANNNLIELKFVVFDTGIGITESNHEKVFESFSQVDASTNRKYGGSGLGLSICRHLVTLMKGEIDFISKKNIGTAFWFKIPFVTNNEFSKRRLSFLFDLSQFKIIFGETALPAFEILLEALDVKYEKVQDTNELNKLRASSSEKIIFIDDLPTEFASSKPSRLFNHLMESAQLPYRIEAFRSGKERFLLGRKNFSEILPNCGNALLVEDHNMNQLIGKLQLEQLGFNVDVCGTGVEAIQSIKQKKYSIVFMDCQMPEMDGYEVTRAIRELEKTAEMRTPIIALTASAMDGEKEKCLQAGMDDYLSKPVEPESLYTTCKKWLGVFGDLELGSYSPQSVPNFEASARQAEEEEIIDKQKLMEHFNKEQYMQLVKMFQNDTSILLVDLEEQIIKKNVKDSAFIAHKLLGASRMIYARTMADKYKDMEVAIRAHSWTKASEILTEIKRQFSQMQEQLLT